MAADGKKQWGDQEYDDDKTEDVPTKFVSSIDANGVKTVTEFRTKEDGTKVKHVSRIKVTKVVKKVNKNVVSRRKLEKFGDCANDGSGVQPNVTYQSGESIRLELRPRKPHESKDVDSSVQKLVDRGDSIVVCRNCGKTGHWTLKCPERRKIGMSQEELSHSLPDESENPETPSPAPGGGGGGSGSGGGGGSGGKYVPPNMRLGANERGQRPRYDRDDSNTLKVTNLSEDTTEDDIRELFRNFGRTSRVYLARDRLTQESRGFAFVTFEMRADAEKAVSKLNGHGYDNLILHVEFAKPREEKKEGGLGK